MLSFFRANRSFNLVPSLRALRFSALRLCVKPKMKISREDRKDERQDRKDEMPCGPGLGLPVARVVAFSRSFALALRSPYRLSRLVVQSFTRSCVSPTLKDPAIA